MKVRRVKYILIILGALACGAGIYAWMVYNGYLLLNHPSRSQYPVVGVDVSHYQGDIDWPVLSDQDIRFAYIKATEGSSHVDRLFAENWEEAKQTELKVGAYHFFSFDSSGKTQADNFIAQVAGHNGMLPPVLDVEYYADKMVNPPAPEAVRAELQVMLDRLTAYYRITPVIYSTEEVWETYLSGHFEDYPLWIRNVYTKPKIDEEWTFWQYSNRERLDGYRGDEEFIDLNVFAGNEDDWEMWLEENGYEMADMSDSSDLSFDSLILLKSNGATCEPYENYVWSQEWTEYGWLNADNLRIRYELPERYKELPQITYGDDFEILYRDSVTYTSMSVFDDTFELRYRNQEPSILETLEPGTYYISIEVVEQGAYVEAEDEYETTGYECVCRLLIE